MITKSEIKIIESEIKDNDIVFDIGSFQGEWTKNVISKKNIKRVYCFEAIRNIFNENLINDKVTLIDDIAISDNIGKKDYHLYIDQPYLSGLYRRNKQVEKEKMGGEFPNKQKIDTISMDFFCDEHDIKSKINFMKIDVEGAELEVLKGCENLLKKNKINKIQFEHGETINDTPYSLKEIIDYLKKYRFKKFYRLLDNEIIEIKEFTNELLNDTTLCNYFVKK